MVKDSQGQPVEGALISLASFGEVEDEHGPAIETQPDGSFLLPLPDTVPDELVVEIERPYFETARVELDETEASALQVERTGLFQWLAFTAYRISGGRMWLLLVALMLFTGVASAFLDKVTTMLLMIPISVQIALALGISCLALLMPEVLASNVIGISTLVGTPTNILIGSYADISFNVFLINLTPGVLLAFVGLVLYTQWSYRKELAAAHDASPAMMEQLAARGRITEPANLKKAGIVAAGMLALFVFGEQIHLVPAVTALIVATALLLWIRPDIEEMNEAVDWTTLVFFITLFIVVGAMQEVGLISVIADMVARLVGENLTIIWCTFSQLKRPLTTSGLFFIWLSVGSVAGERQGTEAEA